MDVQTTLIDRRLQEQTQERFKVWVPGTPVPWKRPRFHEKRSYPDPSAEEYQNLIFARWCDAGCPKLDSHHWKVIVDVLWVRPESHFLKDGVSLSSIGKRMVYPSYCDLDNMLKHIDLFVKCKAVSDDRYAIRKLVTGGWTPGETGVLFTFEGV